MAVTYGFYDSLNHDRLYNAQQMSAIFDGIINDGVFMSVGNQFHTVAGTGMQVIVKSGRAWFDSTWTLNDAEYPLSIDAADVLLTRIDAVVLEVNSEVATRANTIKVVKGTPASTPAKPTLTNTATIHQHALAYVTVAKNTTAITNSMIEIVVGKTETPYVTAILQTTDITDLFNKWENDFQVWFETVKGTLDGDVALNLQNQIDHRVKKADKATSADIEAGTADKWVDASLFNKEYHKLGDICLSSSPIRNNKWLSVNGEQLPRETDLYTKNISDRQQFSRSSRLDEGIFEQYDDSTVSGNTVRTVTKKSVHFAMDYKNKSLFKTDLIIDYTTEKPSTSIYVILQQCTINVYKSTDSGKTWVLRNTKTLTYNDIFSTNSHYGSRTIRDYNTPSDSVVAGNDVLVFGLIFTGYVDGSSSDYEFFYAAYPDGDIRRADETNYITSVSWKIYMSRYTNTGKFIYFYGNVNSDDRATIYRYEIDNLGSNITNVLVLNRVLLPYKYHLADYYIYSPADNLYYAFHKDNSVYMIYALKGGVMDGNETLTNTATQSTYYCPYSRDGSTSGNSGISFQSGTQGGFCVSLVEYEGKRYPLVSFVEKSSGVYQYMMYCLYYKADTNCVTANNRKITTSGIKTAISNIIEYNNKYCVICNHLSDTGYNITHYTLEFDNFPTYSMLTSITDQPTNNLLLNNLAHKNSGVIINAISYPLEESYIKDDILVSKRNINEYNTKASEYTVGTIDGLSNIYPFIKVYE